MEHIRQSIQVDGKHVQDLYKLPCFQSLHKVNWQGEERCIVQIFNDETRRVEYAHTGEYIVQIESEGSTFWSVKKRISKEQ